jgi:chemotaxis protein methyltransferase CheR
VAVDEYVEFCSGLRRLTGVDLGSYKRQQMERRIRSYVDRKAAPTLQAFLRHIQASPTDLDDFLDRITINVSELYRNPEQYELLRTRVLPDLRGGATGLRVWSAGCSYGAEAYTLATMLSDGGTARFQVTGTDIDRRVLERAERGWFSDNDMRSVPAGIRERFFEARDGGFRAGDGLRAHLRFQTHDLLKDRYQPGWDLVLCRNVVIYFTDEARDQVHRSIAAALRPGGYLMVGATERVAEPRAMGLEPVHPFIYRKAA